MHREQKFLSRSWNAYLSLIEESPRLAGGITCEEETNGPQAARWRLFQGRRAGLRAARNPDLEIRAKEDAEQRKKILISSPQPADTFAFGPSVSTSHNRIHATTAAQWLVLLTGKTWWS
jgi:hypothetical protein